MPFLGDWKPIPLTLPKDIAWTPIGVFLGEGEGHRLEVAVASSQTKPTKSQLESAWMARRVGRATPLLYVVLHGEIADVAGYTGERPSVWINIDIHTVEQLAKVALTAPDHHAAIRFLRNVLPNIDSPLPWIRNEGLLATHELREGVPQRGDWKNAGKKALNIRSRRGKELLAGLGYEVVPAPDGKVYILLSKGKKTAVAVLLNEDETTETPSLRFGGFTPAQYAIERAERERLPFVLALSGGQLRLYPAQHGIGVGQRGRTDTFLQLHLDLIPESDAGYLWLAFSAEALEPGGTLASLLENSRIYTASLRERLRDRIYQDVVPNLATAMMRARNIQKPVAQDMADTYQMALVMLFRLLFVSYAEDQGLLPYRVNASYRSRSLKQKAIELLELRNSERAFSKGTDIWNECLRLFHAIDRGNSEWSVPMYDGGLFATSEKESRIGSLLETVSLPDDEFGPILASLLLDESDEGVGPIDFRALGVREFGEVYEGLLENDLAVADVDLVLDADDNYQPAREGEKPIVRKGQGYLHTASGARKSTGSFFTKGFAVEYLLEKALDPSLEEHLARLDALDEKTAAQQFFDFRVADIAMGSGHFLVAAVDHIERGFVTYLAKRPLKGVMAELDRLQKSAAVAMAAVGLEAEVETGQLLRRQIARRCVYGVDKNPMAVELARLSLWLTSLIPGLPLSLLDYNLVCGNSLVGIATPEEAEEALTMVKTGDAVAQLSLDALSHGELFKDARNAIARLGAASDADAAELAEAKKAHQEALQALRPTVALLDIAAATRINPVLEKLVRFNSTGRWVEEMHRLPGSAEHHMAQESFTALPPGHFPVFFPQVFLRERVGFDVIVGNPPWEEATIEEYRFWLRYSPSFRGVPQREQETIKKKLRKSRPDLVALLEREQAEMELLRKALLTGPFPGMGTGDPDLYKGFLWRFWQLLTDGGRIGVVLPRAALAAKGPSEWRKAVLRKGTVEDLTMLLNNQQWVFPDVHPQYTIALLSLRKETPTPITPMPLRGPYRSLAAFQEGIVKEPVSFPVQDVFGWTDTAALPLLPAEESAEVFKILRAHPRLDLDIKGKWRARPYNELHATNDKGLMKFSRIPPEGYWPVFKGESFDLWVPDTGIYYAWADPDKLLPHLQEKRLRGGKINSSPFMEFSQNLLKDEHTLPCLQPRIAIRLVTNRTNTRTVITTLIPPRVFVQNGATYMLFPRGDEKDQAYLLGVLSSIPLDWYSRRFVEANLNFYILNPFPIPRPARTDPLWKRTIALAGRLAAPDRRFQTWANAVGVECGRLRDEEKTDMIAELDAVVACLYGLSESHLRHIFETFHEGWDYKNRLDHTLAHFDRWKRKHE